MRVEHHPIDDPAVSLGSALRLPTIAQAEPRDRKIVHDFRRTAVRNLERAGVPRSAAMKMTGHLTESIYRRYAIVDESMLRDAARRLDAIALG